MLELVREVELHRDAARRTLGELHERGFVVVVAVAEEDVLGVEREIARVAEDEVEAFLRHEARGERKDRGLPAAEPRCALEGDAAALLPRESVGRIATRNEGVGCRIPDILIDSVDDADEAVAHGDEHAVEPEAALLGAKFVGVRGAHRNDEVGVDQSTLEQVHSAMPLELPKIVERRRQADVGHGCFRKVSLIPGVVNREHGANSLVIRVRHVLGFQIDARQRRLPVVRVHDARRLRQHARKREKHRAREQGIAARVVGIVARRIAVEPGPVEVQLTFHEQHARRAGTDWSDRLIDACCLDA